VRIRSIADASRAAWRNPAEALPAAERAAIAALAAELELRSVPADEALRRVARHFGAFSYSTYREAAAPRGTTALADFLQRSKSGHCEYFAAATTLLLRAAGIPARYATGFAMMEYSELEGAYVVRARHAHAWTRAWVGDRWIDVDTTPPIWFAEEARLAPAWQKVADFFRWASYRWAQRTGFEASEAWLGLLGVLVVVLGWRVVRGKRAGRGRQEPTTQAARSYPGLDSEFYATERAVVSRGVSRASAETLAAWGPHAAASIDEARRAQFERALQLHLRFRFDPNGLNASDRTALRDLSLSSAEGLQPSKTPSLFVRIKSPELLSPGCWMPVTAQDCVLIEKHAKTRSGTCAAGSKQHNTR
jgi:hypothetical protein